MLGCPFQAGEDSWGTDEAAFNKVLSLRNYAQLRATFDAYVGIAGRDIEEAIESECSGTLKDGLLAIGEDYCSLVLHAVFVYTIVLLKYVGFVGVV